MSPLSHCGRRRLLLLLFVAIIPGTIHAQVINWSSLPAWTSNTRIYSDRYPVKHPSLTLNGFDNGTQNGYGLRQMLDRVYNTPQADVLITFSTIVQLAADTGYRHSPSSVDQIRENTQRLEARALVALASYVISNNGRDPATLNPALPSPQRALDSLRSAFLDFDSWEINADLGGADAKDGVKWATAVSNVARAFDLYLALENAYKRYDITEYDNLDATRLLSSSLKLTLLTRYTLLIDELEQYGGEYDGYAGVDGYDYTAGNWPLKV